MGNVSFARKVATLSLLIALALIMFLIENLFPPLLGIPGAKMGLANVFSFATLIIYGPWEAFIVVAVRTLLGAIFAGNVSALLYSFTGGIVSTAFSAILIYCVYPRVSILAVSIFSAVAHNVTQNAVFVLLTLTPEMFSLLPYLCSMGVISGAIIGGIIMLIFKKVPLSVFERAVYKNKKPIKGKRRFYLKAVKGKNFFSGVHVNDMKYLAKDSPTEVMPNPAEVAISTSQSLGKPAVPCVNIGDKVKQGQVIAVADGAISSDVFASVSGEVVAIKDLLSASGVTEKFIFIKNDGLEETEYLPPLENPTPEQIKERIKVTGIVGLGGAGFPTAVKVAPKTPVDTLILNGAECEPYLTCDHRLMLENTDEIVRGARLIAKAVNISNIIIGIEENKPDCIEAFEKYEDIKVVSLKKKYPMGSEKQLIYSTTGRKVPIGKLPAEVGTIVQNVATAFAVCEAVEKGKPLYERIVTVSGEAVKQPKNLWVKLGTPIKEIVEYCGGELQEPKKLIQGGPMTGLALANYDGYTHKTTSGILLLSEKEAAADEPTPCLSCGKCADVCPMKLMPMNVEFYSAAGDYDSAEKLGHATCCIECGSCEYVCPAKRPLIQALRKTKAAMREKAKKGGK